MRMLLTALVVATTLPSVAEERHQSALFAPAVVFQLMSAPGFEVRNPERAFGTQKAVDLFRRTMRRLTEQFKALPDVCVGDLSVKGGGRLRPHRSHRDGRDIDIGFYFKDGRERRWFERATPRTLDAPRTWALIKALVDSGEVEYVFLQLRLQKPVYDYARKTGTPKAVLDRIFQYPQGRRSKRGIVRHERGHDDHLHIRFKR